MVLSFLRYHSGEDIASAEILPCPANSGILDVPVFSEALPRTSQHPSSLRLSRESQKVNILRLFTNWGLKTHLLDGERCDLAPIQWDPGAVEAALRMSR
jgi:hypothetical protein